MATGCAGQDFDLAANILNPARQVRLDVGRFQNGHIVGRRAQFDRLGRMKAVSVSGPPRLQAESAQRKHGPAMQAQQPFHRPHEGFVATAPAHALGHQRVHQLEAFLEDRRQQLRRRLAGLGLAEHQIAVFLRQCSHVGGAGASKAFGGPGRCSVLERGGQRRALALDRLVRLLLRHRLDDHGNPARCGIGLRCAMCDRAAVQTVAQAFGQCRGERRHIAGREVFTTDFEQQRRRLRHGIRGSMENEARDCPGSAVSRQAGAH